MKNLLQRASDAGIIMEVIDGKLKLFAENNQIDPELLIEIKSKKDEITQFLVRNDLDSIYVNQYHSITQIPKQESYSVSHAQKRLWVICQFDLKLGAYNLPSNVRINDDLDIDSFKKAIISTIQRHEILRTVFKVDQNGELRQWIIDKDALQFEIKQFDFRLKEDKEYEVNAFIEADSYLPFDLENGPLLRASLLQIDDSEYVFYYNMHHIISDGWSLEVLAKDVFTFYQAYKIQLNPDIAELNIQYKDYSAWQNKHIEDGLYKTQRTYWLENLKGELPILNLPTNKLRPKVKTYNGRAIKTFIDPNTTSKIRSFAIENEASSFITLLAAWNVLFYRYTNERDIIIGTPVAGREHVDLENQIGCYVNAIALRNEIKPNHNFRQFFSSVKNCSLNGYNNQMYPFDALVEELDIVRDSSRSPIFDISISFHNPIEENESPEHNHEAFDSLIELGDAKVKNDIELHFQEEGKHVAFTTIFNQDVYENDMIEMLIIHFKILVNKLLDEPEVTLSLVDFLTPQEKNRLLYTLNQTTFTYDANKTLVDVFQEQVHKSPDNVALIYNSKKMTYKELDEISNQLANCLLDHCGIESNQLIGLQLNRSEWVIIAILGILKSGSAYLPIDPEYPLVRKQRIIEDSKIKLLVTESSFIYDLDYFVGDLFALDLEFDSEKFSSEKVARSVKPEDLAYVVYTSGSTGNPKGVMVEHHAIMNTIFAQIDIFGINEDTKGLQFASFSFDASISEIFTVLLAGASLIIVDEYTRKDVDQLISFMNEHEVDIATIPPSYLRKINIDDLSGLKKLITAGEMAPVDKVMEFVEYGMCFNAYGPTETSICATIFKYEKDKILMSNSLPIGNPIFNTQIYILSENNQLQPFGVIGEICVGGKGLSNGYLNHSELTDSKFIENPYKKGDKIYKTGDLGRWLQDGNVEFLGRLDDQVKVRGFRIELAEIEGTLLKNTNIRQAKVLVSKNQFSDNELVAYLILNEKLNTSDLRTYLKLSLPEYMIPTHFVEMSEFPLTSNGKLDLKSLINSSESALSTGTEYVAPRNEIDAKLIEIWKGILGVNVMGIKDSFFELGGHSLKALLLINKLDSEFNIKFNLEVLLSNPTIEVVSNEIKAKLWVDSVNEVNQENRDIIEL